MYPFSGQTCMCVTSWSCRWTSETLFPCPVCPPHLSPPLHAPPTEGEPGPDDTPHITAPMPEMVEEGFRDIQEEATARGCYIQRYRSWPACRSHVMVHRIPTTDMEEGTARGLRRSW